LNLRAFRTTLPDCDEVGVAMRRPVVPNPDIGELETLEEVEGPEN